MTFLFDSEHREIPTDAGATLFEAVLCDHGDGAGPTLTINGPRYFETSDGEYESDGVFHAPLQSILEDYLLEMVFMDAGQGRDAFCKWLRDYADRLEAVVIP